MAIGRHSPDYPRSTGAFGEIKLAADSHILISGEKLLGVATQASTWQAPIGFLKDNTPDFEHLRLAPALGKLSQPMQSTRTEGTVRLTVASDIPITTTVFRNPGTTTQDQP